MRKNASPKQSQNENDMNVKVFYFILLGEKPCDFGLGRFGGNFSVGE